MSLKRNLLLGYGVASALMSLVIAWAVSNLVTLGRASDAILHENYRSIQAAQKMLAALDRQDSGILLILLGDREIGARQVRDSETLFLQWLARAKDNITIAGEEDVVTSIETAYAEYRQATSELVTPAASASAASTAASGPRAQGPDPELLAPYRQAAGPALARLRSACTRLLRLNEETMQAASVRAAGLARLAIWSTGGVAAAALLLTLAFSLLLSERIVQPLRRFMAASRQIAAGNYGVHVPSETADELGELAREFNQMAAQLGRFHELRIDEIITEQRKGEAILASIEDGLVVFDTDLAVTGINPAARRMLGLESATDTALRCGDMLPAGDVLRLIEATVKIGTPPSAPEDERLVLLPGSDSPCHCLYSVTPIHGQDRNLIGVVLLLRDVTRLKEVERLKSEFVMAASHELRTPLTSIGMSVDLLREHAAAKLAERERELLATAHEEVERMKALISDLLDLAKVEVGRIPLDFAPVQVGDLVTRVHGVFRGQLAEKGVHLAISAPDDLPAIRADATKIAWVLTNLVSNALRHVSPGGHIHVTAQPVGPHVHLSVSDNGPGIPPEFQARIFQKFVQVKGRETGGTGLGLAICREIVRAHGGSIWVESQPGQGSTFTFAVRVAE